MIWRNFTPNSVSTESYSRTASRVSGSWPIKKSSTRLLIIGKPYWTNYRQRKKIHLKLRSRDITMERKRRRRKMGKSQQALNRILITMTWTSNLNRIGSCYSLRSPRKRKEHHSENKRWGLEECSKQWNWLPNWKSCCWTVGIKVQSRIQRDLDRFLIIKRARVRKRMKLNMWTYCNKNWMHLVNELRRAPSSFLNMTSRGRKVWNLSNTVIWNQMWVLEVPHLMWTTWLSLMWDQHRKPHSTVWQLCPLPGLTQWNSVRTLINVREESSFRAIHDYFADFTDEFWLRRMIEATPLTQSLPLLRKN